VIPPLPVFDMETVNGVDHVFDRIHILDGEIKGIHTFYYPQQSPEAQAQASNWAIRA